MLHSYDVWWGRKTRYMFDAVEAAGFDWLEPHKEICVPWESWGPPLSPEKMTQSLCRHAFGHLHRVYKAFSAATPRSKRAKHNWCTMVCYSYKMPEAAHNN